MPHAKGVVDRVRQRQGSLETLPQRFHSKVSKAADVDACWLWTGTRNKLGYGQIDKVAAHRVAFFLATGTDPDQNQVCHRCDNPPCVRPDHLFLGSHADNMADMAAKGRAATPALVLNQIEVELIRTLWTSGVLQKELALKFGVRQQQISRIVRGQSRTDVAVHTPWQKEGFRTPVAVLTDEDVTEIRNRYLRGGVTQQRLATEYGVCQPHISRIVCRRIRTQMD